MQFAADSTPDSTPTPPPPRVPVDPNNAVHALVAWHVYTRGTLFGYPEDVVQVMATIKARGGGNSLSKVPWAKKNFLRGLLTPIEAVPPMKHKKNGQPRKNEVEKYNARVELTQLMNGFLNGFPNDEHIGEPVEYDHETPWTSDPYAYLDGCKDFPQLFKPLSERIGKHPTFSFGFLTRFKRHAVVIASWTYDL